MRFMNMRSVLTIMIFCMLKYVTLKLAVSQNKCGSKLLDDMILVPDSSFTASSSYNYFNELERKMDLSPKAARESYDKDNQEFAWCPMNRVSSDLKEFLEIDMGRLVVINFAQTRGRFAQGAGKEFIPYYKIKYRRELTENWRLYKKFDSSRGLTDILKGPSDPFLDAYETLDPPIITRWIRIYPFSYTLMRVCMKLQLFGCTFESSVLEYRIPQGSEAPKSLLSLPGVMATYIKIFQDSSYDGSTDQGLLYGGLGRLTDNKTGDNFLLNRHEAQYYVGWNIKNFPVSADQSITLWFRFDSVRNFSHVRLNSFENTTMKIAGPKKLVAKFSIPGSVFNDADTIVFESKPSEVQWRLFDLEHKIGQYLQLKLYFQSEWIILTEIEFISDKAVGFQSHKEIQNPTENQVVTEAAIIPDNPKTTTNSVNVADVMYILMILLCILVAFIVAILVSWLIWRHKRNKRKTDWKKNELTLYSQDRFKTPNYPTSTQAGLTHIQNSYQSNYTPGTLQMAPRVQIGVPSDPCIFKHNMSSQNILNIPKPPGQANDNNVYTSIPGSDNDSSLGTDYMASSGVNSSHPYTQTMPGTGSVADYIISQPQITGNPLVDLYDNNPHLFTRKVPNSGICSYDPEMLTMSNPIHCNSIPTIQSFSGASNGFQTLQYNDNSLERTFYPPGNSYQSSPMKNNHLLKG